MAALALTLKRNTPCRASYTFTGVGAGDTIANAQINPATLVAGPLDTFLNATYATTALLIAAFATAGGEVSVVSDTAVTFAPGVIWALDGGKPSLVVDSNGGAGNCSITIEVAHSLIG